MKKVMFAALSLLLLCGVSTFAEEKGGNNQQSGNNQDKDEKTALSALPKAVTDAVATARPGGTMVEAEKKTKKDGTVFYEVNVTQGDKKYEVKVDAAGKVLANEADDENEKGEKDQKGENK